MIYYIYIYIYRTEEDALMGQVAANLGNPHYYGYFKFLFSTEAETTT